MRFWTVPIFAAALLAAGLVSAAAQAQLVLEPRPYYVEFRAAENGAYGHSYIAFGRLDEAGKPATAYYADLHPTGSLPVLVLGHVMPVNASTRPKSATRNQKVTARFLHPLTEAEYNQLTDVIARMRATRRAWSLVAYNCNDFVADVAGGIGLRTPNTLTLPHEFIGDLQAMNQLPSPSEPVATAERAQPSAPVSAVAATPPAVKPARPATARPAIAMPSIEPLWRKITSARPVPPASIPATRQTALR